MIASGEGLSSSRAEAQEAPFPRLHEASCEPRAGNVQLVHRLLQRYPKPSETWADDLDPPVSQE